MLTEQTGMSREELITALSQYFAAGGRPSHAQRTSPDRTGSLAHGLMHAKLDPLASKGAFIWAFFGLF